MKTLKLNESHEKLLRRMLCNVLWEAIMEDDYIAWCNFDNAVTMLKMLDYDINNTVESIEEYNREDIEIFGHIKEDFNKDRFEYLKSLVK